MTEVSCASGDMQAELVAVKIGGLAPEVRGGGSGMLCSSFQLEAAGTISAWKGENGLSETKRRAVIWVFGVRIYFPGEKTLQQSVGLLPVHHVRTSGGARSCPGLLCSQLRCAMCLVQSQCSELVC